MGEHLKDREQPESRLGGKFPQLKSAQSACTRTREPEGEGRGRTGHFLSAPRLLVKEPKARKESADGDRGEGSRGEDLQVSGLKDRGRGRDISRSGCTGVTQRDAEGPRVMAGKGTQRETKVGFKMLLSHRPTIEANAARLMPARWLRGGACGAVRQRAQRRIRACR